MCSSAKNGSLKMFGRRLHAFRMRLFTAGEYTQDIHVHHDDTLCAGGWLISFISSSSAKTCMGAFGNTWIARRLCSDFNLQQPGHLERSYGLSSWCPLIGRLAIAEVGLLQGKLRIVHCQHFDGFCNRPYSITYLKCRLAAGIDTATECESASRPNVSLQGLHQRT